MADIRIKVAKDKAKLVKALRAGEGSTGPFQTYVDVIVFAAALGRRKQKYIPVKEFSRKDPDPIPFEHFESRGHNQLIDLIAISHTQDPKILDGNENHIVCRVEYFENYANGGLSIIEEKITGTNDVLNQIQLLMIQERRSFDIEENSLDLSFLSI